MDTSSVYKSLQEDLEKIKLETEVAEVKQDSESFCKLVDECLEEDYEIIQDLDRLLDNARYYHSNCNIVKTTGTTASILGAASLIGCFLMVPITGGFSLLPGAIGAGLSVGGGVTNVVTDMVEDKITKGIIAEIESLVDRKEKSTSSLNKQIGNVQKIVEYFDLKGIAKEYALASILKALANQTLDLTNLPNTNILKTFALSAVVMHEAEDMALKYLPQLGKYISISQSHLRIIYSFFGITTTTGATALKAAGRLLGVVSAGVFAIVDVAMLIRDWKSNPPSEATIVEVKKQLLDEIDKLKEMQEIIESLKDKVWFSMFWSIPVVGPSESCVSNFMKNFNYKEKCKENDLKMLMEDGFLKNIDIKAVCQNELVLYEHTVSEKLLYDVFDIIGSVKISYGQSNSRYSVINQSILNLYQDVINDFFKMKDLKVKKVNLNSPISKNCERIIKRLMIANMNENVYYIDLYEKEFKKIVADLKRKCVYQMCDYYENPPEITDFSIVIRTMIKIIADQNLFVDQIALKVWLKQSTCSKSDRLVYERAVNEIKFMLYKLPDHLSDWVNQLK